MNSMTAMVASGLRARMESLELLANNVANATTGGYKADREFYSLYAAPEAQGDGLSTMPVVERSWIDLSQGQVENTGNPLDLAISGSGFFAVNGTSGTLYTRNGSLRIAADGTLVTADGYAVRGAGGSTLTLDSSRAVEVSADGTVTQDGNPAGRIELVDFAGGAGIAKEGDTYFRIDDPAVRPASGSASIAQGRLETSNTGVSESAVRLVSVMRQFEMLQKAAGLASEMNRQAVQQVAKVGSS
jgi:flagellar basal-body rod protein FlgF